MALENTIIQNVLDARIPTRARWLLDRPEARVGHLTPERRSQLVRDLLSLDGIVSVHYIRNCVDLLCHDPPIPADDYFYAAIIYKKCLMLYDGHPQNPCLYTPRSKGGCTLM